MKKTSWILIMLLLFLMGTLSGCSPAEKGLLGLYQEMTDMDRYEGSGEFSVDLEALPAVAANEADLLPLIDALGKYALTYQGKLDMVSKEMIYSFYLKDRTNGSSRELTTLLLTKDSLYVKVDSLLAFLRPFNDTRTNKELDQAFAGTEYLAIPLSELAKGMAPDPGMAMQPFPASGDLLGDSREQQQVMMKIVDGLAEQVLSGFSSGVVSKSGSQYTMSLTPESGAELLVSLLTYLVNHAEDLGSYLTSALADFSDAEMNTLGLDPAKRSEYIVMVQEGINELVADREEILAQISAMSGPASEEFIQPFAGSQYTATIKKTGTQAYDSTALVKIMYQDPQNLADRLDLSISGSSEVAACPAFTVEVPSEKVITLAELERRTTQTMKVQTASGSYQLMKGDSRSQGTIGVKIIDGATYLQLRKVAETLNEQVGWDPALRSAYVVKADGTRINMTGMILNGSTYIKIRDFNALSYQISWDAATKTVTIVKKNLF